MTTNGMEYIVKAMSELDLPFAFYEWVEAPPETYFVAETCQEVDPVDESGRQETVIILGGFTKGSYMELEQAKDRLKKIDRSEILSDGMGVALYYNTSNNVPLDNSDYKKIQVNLTLKEWKVN
jgi:hypothetical protein